MEDDGMIDLPEPKDEPEVAVAETIGGTVTVVPAPEPDILALPIAQVLSDASMTDQAVEALTARIDEALARRKAIEDELTQLNAKNELCKRMQTRHQRNKPPAPPPFVAIHKRQREEAERRAARLTDMSAAEVRDALRVSSKLDEALRNRPRAVRG